MPVADAIPTVDLQDLRSEDAADHARAGEAIRKAFGDYGLIYIRNHGVDTDALEELYREFIAFTESPREEKSKVWRKDLWYQRGWTPPNTEQAVVAGGQPDFKECYFMAPEALDPVAKAHYPELYSENVWPEGKDQFRSLYEGLGQHVHAIGLDLLRGTARALGLPGETFTSMCQGGPHVSRALRYLSVSKSQIADGVVWGEEHTDFNLLTLLPGGCFYDPQGELCGRPDETSGLYLRTRPTAEHPRGRQVRGLPPKGCMVAQVGQQLEILTGGKLLATPHVIRCPETSGYTRTAFAHFIHLHSGSSLFPLPNYRSEDAVKAYRPPVLAGTYSLKTLVDIGLAPPDAIGQLGYQHYDRLAGFRAEEDSE